MADSSALVHITMNRGDLSEYKEIKDGIHLNTASKSAKPQERVQCSLQSLKITEDKNWLSGCTLSTM